MLIHSAKPLSYHQNRIQIPLRAEDLLDENVYDEVWLPWGDDPESDIYRLMEQNRL
ncbi:MAG: hypothetical protein ACOX0N_06865 [Syntrophomonadaceae bacterium]|jgi:hypothetical protein|nr:hypothetical protein [Syntrophomonadaceae bacterium]